MKFLILGGLGYLGRCLHKHLSKTDEVFIIDGNIHNRYDQSELDVFGDKLHICNLASTELSKRDLNWCCDIDTVISCLPTPDLDFLTNHRYQSYHTKFFENIKLLGSCLPNATNFVQLVDTMLSDPTYVDYWHEMVIRIDIPADMYHLPSLYGMEESFDNSTFINNCVLSFNAEKMFFLEGDPYEMIQFTEVNQYCNRIASILNGTGHPAGDRLDMLPKIMLANIIQEIFGASEHEMQIDISAERNFSIESGICFTSEEPIKRFIKAVQVGFSQGKTQELYHSKYDSKKTYELIKLAHQYKEFIV